MENDNYAKRLKSFKLMYLNESPIEHLKLGQIATERVIKKKGQNLRHKFNGEKLTFLEFYNFDVVLLVLFIIVTLSSRQ